MHFLSFLKRGYGQNFLKERVEKIERSSIFNQRKENIT